jgi:hypothetical protein
VAGAGGTGTGAGVGVARVPPPGQRTKAWTLVSDSGWLRSPGVAQPAAKSTPTSARERVLGLMVVS